VMAVDDPEVKGLPVSVAKEKVKEKLLSSNMAFKLYELNRKAFCRAGGEIIAARIKGQWFIDYSTHWWKERVRKYVEEKLVVKPEKYKAGLLSAVDWLEMRPCARRRGIGTKLPFDPEWVIESLSDSTIYMAFYTVVHVIREHGITADQLKPEVFDYVFLGVGDPVEVSKNTGIPVEALEKMRMEFTYWYPVDQRHTGVAHISNHLAFYIFHHAALFPPEHWPRAITLNEMVIREGAKMSKSKGNVILLRDIAEKYSADLFRLYVAGAANLDTVLDWREKDVATTLESLRRFVALAKRAVEAKCAETPMNAEIDKWLFSRFNKLVAEATESLEKMEVRDYVQKAFYQVLAAVEHYRERAGEEKAVCAVKAILDKWIRLLNPVIPHVTEEVGEWLGYTKPVSASAWPEPDYAAVDEEVEVLENAVVELVEDVKNVLNVVKPVKNKLTVVVASPWKREAVKLAEEGADVRKVVQVIREKYGLEGREREIVEVVQKYKREPDKSILVTSAEREYAVFREAADYIARKTGLEVAVVWEEEARNRGIPRAEKAYPLKPAIYIE